MPSHTWMIAQVPELHCLMSLLARYVLESEVFQTEFKKNVAHLMPNLPITRSLHIRYKGMTNHSARGKSK
jgi:hypothetical protein